MNLGPPLNTSNLRKIARQGRPLKQDETIQLGDGYLVLHHTKGYRRISHRRFLVSPNEMVATHHAVIARAGGTFPFAETKALGPRRNRNTRAQRRARRIDAMRKDLRAE